MFCARRLAVLMIAGATTVAHSQTIPLPKPAPKARGAAVPADGIPSSTSSASPTYAGTPPTAVAPPVVRPQPQTAPQQQQSLLPDPRKLFGLGGSTITFDANQRTLAGKMSTYLSSISTLSGNFVQIGPNGAKTTGDFVIQKPGKVRFQYDPPSPIGRHCRRHHDGDPRPQTGDAGHLSPVARRRCASCYPTGLIC